MIIKKLKNNNNKVNISIAC